MSSLVAGNPEVIPGRRSRCEPTSRLPPAWLHNTPAGRSRPRVISPWRSGPMRAAAGSEPLFEAIGHREQPPVAVGVLEAKSVAAGGGAGGLPVGRASSPTVDAVVAPTTSLAGTVQIVARSVETAMHKLLGTGIRSEARLTAAGGGPVASGGPRSIGGDRPHERRDFVRRRSDALGARPTMAHRPRLVRVCRAGLRSDLGQPFAAIFARYQHDFYRIDPLLFSPAMIRLRQPGQRQDVAIRPYCAPGVARVVRKLSEGGVIVARPFESAPC